MSDRRFAHIIAVLTSPHNAEGTSAAPAPLVNAWLDGQEQGISTGTRNERRTAPLASSRWLQLRRSKPLPKMQRQLKRRRGSAQHDDRRSQTSTSSLSRTLRGSDGDGRHHHPGVADLPHQGVEFRHRQPKPTNDTAAPRQKAARQPEPKADSARAAQPERNAVSQQRHLGATASSTEQPRNPRVNELARHAIPQTVQLSRPRPPQSVPSSRSSPDAVSSRQVAPRALPTRRHPKKVPPVVDGGAFSTCSVNSNSPAVSALPAKALRPVKPPTQRASNQPAFRASDASELNIWDPVVVQARRLHRPTPSCASSSNDSNSSAPPSQWSDSNIAAAARMRGSDGVDRLGLSPAAARPQDSDRNVEPAIVMASSFSSCNSEGTASGRRAPAAGSSMRKVTVAWHPELSGDSGDGVSSGSPAQPPQATLRGRPSAHPATCSVSTSSSSESSSVSTPGSRANPQLLPRGRQEAVQDAGLSSRSEAPLAGSRATGPQLMRGRQQLVVSTSHCAASSEGQPAAKQRRSGAQTAGRGHTLRPAAKLAPLAGGWARQSVVTDAPVAKPTTTVPDVAPHIAPRTRANRAHRELRLSARRTVAAHGQQSAQHSAACGAHPGRDTRVDASHRQSVSTDSLVSAYEPSQNPPSSLGHSSHDGAAAVVQWAPPERHADAIDSSPSLVRSVDTFTERV